MTEALCHIDDLSEPGARGFELPQPGGTLAFFIVRQHGRAYAYLNKCPHVGVNLEWRPDDFLNIDKSLIQCSVHGAEFLIESGHCIGGPCRGQSLTALPLRQSADGYLFLDEG